jgi:integrase
VFVGAYGGLRIGELAGLRRSRVDLATGTVDVAENITEVLAVPPTISAAHGHPGPSSALVLPARLPRLTPPASRSQRTQCAMIPMLD